MDPVSVAREFLAAALALTGVLADVEVSVRGGLLRCDLRAVDADRASLARERTGGRKQRASTPTARGEDPRIHLAAGVACGPAEGAPEEASQEASACTSDPRQVYGLHHATRRQVMEDDQYGSAWVWCATGAAEAVDPMMLGILVEDMGR